MTQSEQKNNGNLFEMIRKIENAHCNSVACIEMWD